MKRMLIFILSGFFLASTCAAVPADTVQEGGKKMALPANDSAASARISHKEPPLNGKNRKEETRLQRKEKRQARAESMKESAEATRQAFEESLSQAKESIGNWFNDNIKANTVGDFDEIQRQNNQDFSLMVSQPWSAYPLEIKETEGPLDGAFFTSKSKRGLPDTSAPPAIVPGPLLTGTEPLPSPVPEAYYDGAGTDAVSQMLTKKQFIPIKFYGKELKIHYVSSLRSTGLGKGKEKNVAKFWQHLSDEDFNAVLFQLYQCKQELGLNDFLYYQLVRAFADQLFAKGKHGENLGFTVFILNQTGYDARLARLENDKETQTVLLLPFYEESYGLPFVRIGGNAYYLMDAKLSKRERAEAKVYTYSKAFATARHPFSLRFTPASLRTDPLYGQFQGYIYDERIAQMEMSLPSAPFILCAEAPFSGLMQKTLQYRFKPELDSLVQRKQDANLKHEMGEREKQEIRILGLSEFLNRNVTAQAKQSARLTGKALYPDQIFFRKGAGDIRDRSLLFCQICNRILEIPAILLLYPDFALPAVAFEEGPFAEDSPFRQAGTISFQGKTYWLCGELPKGITPAIQPQILAW